MEYRSVALNNNTVSGALRFRYYITNCDPNSSIDNISNTSKQVTLNVSHLNYMYNIYTDIYIRTYVYTYIDSTYMIIFMNRFYWKL